MLSGVKFLSLRLESLVVWVDSEEIIAHCREILGETFQGTSSTYSLKYVQTFETSKLHQIRKIIVSMESSIVTKAISRSRKYLRA